MSFSSFLPACLLSLVCNCSVAIFASLPPTCRNCLSLLGSKGCDRILPLEQQSIWPSPFCVSYISQKTDISSKSLMEEGNNSAFLEYKKPRVSLVRNESECQQERRITVVGSDHWSKKNRNSRVLFDQCKEQSSHIAQKCTDK